ncbi:aldehyde:ferredoxin oxidoreductase, partial [candidate division MSBL1 archaeon SCGC-AAA259D14]
GVELRRTGHDMVVFEGIAEKPLHVNISDEDVEFKDAGELWGKDTFEREDILYEKLGSQIGTLLIGKAGENLVRFATVLSMKGRAGGRTGMGAVMGSKKIAAITFDGNKKLPSQDEEKIKKLGKEGYKEITQKDGYDFWRRQGTMVAVRLCDSNSILPTKNFGEGVFEDVDSLDGFSMERFKVDRRGCAKCNMLCGNVVEDEEGEEVEVDYENIALLGPNLGIGGIKKVSVLNKLCDQYGLDTISAGSAIAFAMEASEKGIIDEDLEFGDYEGAKELLKKIAFREDIGDILAEGVKRASEKWGGGSEKWAMHIKGLEITGYDCHTLPGMALAFGTAAIGAHHKESWMISREIESDRNSYDIEKVKQVIDDQRKRGGAFECFTTCRLPWIEVDFDLNWYEKFFKATTGVEMTWDEFHEVGDRIYSLIRAFFVREFGEEWSREMDVPPDRWFEDPITKGDFEGRTLDREEYNEMLSKYYRERCWNEEGVPTEETLKDLGLDFTIQELSKY